VHFTIQRLSRRSGLSGVEPPIEIAAIGGSQRLKVPALYVSGDPIATNGAWSYAAPQQQYDLDLPDAGTDVVIRVAPQMRFGIDEFFAASEAVMIDDLWAE
jgi:hypothetical protein